MMEAKFKIGDRVKVVPNQEYGIITDIMFSYRLKENMYEVSTEDDKVVTGTFVASDLEPAPKPRDFSMDIKIDIAQNIVIATLYEDYDTIKKPLRRGHGHISTMVSLASHRLQAMPVDGYTRALAAPTPREDLKHDY